ncbi:MAG: aminoglycoside 3'-phosphotransferase [Eubacteriales bacterium]
MERIPIEINIENYPAALQSILRGARVYDSRCRSGAQVLFIDRDGGYFLKSDEHGKLVTEAELTKYFHSLGLGARVLHFESGERDFLLTERIRGKDLTHADYLSRPEWLVDKFAGILRELHERDGSDCPIPDRTSDYRAFALDNYRTGNYDKTSFPDSFGYASAEEAMAVINAYGQDLRSDTLIHGDYCLPNVIFNGRDFSAFVDVGCGGMGDRHIDLFWGLWTLWYNLGKTDEYSARFLDAYGRDKVIPECLKAVAAYEVFG